MALIERSARASVDTSMALTVPQITANLYAGEDLPAVAPCRLDEDGMVYLAEAGDPFAGITPEERKEGEPVTLFSVGIRAKLSDGELTPGQLLYLSDTPGEFADAAEELEEDVFDTPIAQAINEHDIRVVRAI